jgi:hypothetical protein
MILASSPPSSYPEGMVGSDLRAVIFAKRCVPPHVTMIQRGALVAEDLISSAFSVAER